MSSFKRKNDLDNLNSSLKIMKLDDQQPQDPVPASMMIQDEVAVHPGYNRGLQVPLDTDAKEKEVNDQNALATNPDQLTTPQASRAIDNAAIDVPAPDMILPSNDNGESMQTLRAYSPTGNGSESESSADPQNSLGPASLAQADGLADASTKIKTKPST